MRAQASICPKLHLFVCANHRDAGDPLGAGCGARGEAVYDAMKNEVARRGAFRDVWVTKTHCLGICPKRGCTVAEYPKGVVWREVGLDDLPAFFEENANGKPVLAAKAVASDAANADAGEVEYAAKTDLLATRAHVDATLDHMETLQAKKVIDLARRLRPGLTAEDIRNPHDFPELDDNDWHYEDGILTGIQSVMTALRAADRDGSGGET